MYRKLILSIILVLVASFGLLAVLFKIAPLANRNNNGFTRFQIDAKVIPIHTKEVKVPLQKICGATFNNVFFSIPNPEGIIMFDTSLENQDTLIYGLGFSKDMLGSNNTFVDSPKVTFLANNIKAIFIGKIGAQRLDALLRINTSTTRSIKISSGNIVLRGLDTSLNKQVFQKINISTGQLTAEEVVINDQGPGGFENDGFFKYDNVLQRVFYIESYRNRFYCLDTSLKTIYTAHTIDTTTISTAPIEQLKTKEKDRLIPAKHRTIVNEESFIGNGILFILSGLRADNELKSDFNNNSTVDMYRIVDGKYVGSFHIPKQNNKKVKSIILLRDLLIVLYKNQIRSFKLYL